MMKNKLLIRVAAVMFPLLFFSLWTFGQAVTVQGTVVDGDNEPLIGANVVVKGSTTGTITDINGKYTLSVPSANDVLVFSFIGYLTEEVAIEGRTQVDVKLLLDMVALGDVVVIGYGTQRKEAVTGSVSSVKGDVVRDVPSSNISQALQGRVSGVELSQTSTKPGAEMQIRIRGTRSLNANNDPLVVLDGIPFAGSISDISPSDIKSIDILKDASATAIYGSRGANGVIIVTTNKGQIGKKATVNVNSYQGFKNVFGRYPMMNGSEFAALRAAAGKYNNGPDEANDVDTDWQDLLYRTAMVSSNDVSVNGGTETASYNYGIGYYKDEAVLPGQDYNRFSMRASLDQKIGNYFHFGFSTNSNYSVNNGNNLGIYSTLSTSPLANPYNADGSLRRTVRMELDENWVYTKENVEALGDSWIDQSKAFGSYNTFFGEVSIPGVEGLKYRTNVGLNFRMTNGGSYTGKGVFSTNIDNPSTATVSNSLTTNWAIENLLTYDRVFADKHNVNVVAMYSAEQSRYNRSHVSVKEIPADYFQFYNLGRSEGDQTIDPGQQWYNVSGLLSYMGRAMYSYDNKYMISVAFRNDGSSRLAPGYKWHSYPAVSLGWNIKKESFMENITYINSLKLRAGYGETSNQAVDPYKTLGLLNTRPYNFGPDTYATGYYVSELPNPQLGWEFSETYNFGIDFSVLNNRLSGTMEYYIQNTKDVLLSVSYPSTNGVSSRMENIGQTQNKGFELSLDGVILDNLNGWTWEAGLNLYANRNKLVALASGQDRNEANCWFVGYPINVLYDYEKIGLWNESDADYQYLQTYEPGGNVGMIKVKYTGEYNADGSPVRAIGADDRQIIELDPKFQGGFNTRVAYNNFDLSMVAAFRAGGTLVSSLYSSSGYLNMLTGRRGNVKVDYWTPENTDAKYPNPSGIISGDNPKYGSTLGYFNGSYLKIRTITLGYNLESIGAIKNFGIDKLRIYATVQNPFVLFSPYYNESGMDPETNSYGNENAAVAYGNELKRILTIGTNTPTTRNYLIGINLTF